MKSGPCLIQLLQNDLRPILRKEDGNRDAMYLYSLGTWWVAFEAPRTTCPAAIPARNVSRSGLLPWMRRSTANGGLGS